MPRKYCPTDRNLIVRRSTSPKTNAAGAIVEGTWADSGPYEGVVVAMGPMTSRSWGTGCVREGDRVVFQSSLLLEEHEDHAILIVKGEDVLAVIIESGEG